jgi:1,2-phenylacetyl-CoA epoxidase catalytic subunit
VGLTLTQAQKMSTKLNNRQLMAAEMLGMGYRPSVVAEKLQVTRETVSRWQQKPDFEEMQRQSYMSTLNDITNETTLIISKANSALLTVFDDENAASSSKANIAVRYLSCVGNQNTIYQRLSEAAYKMSNSEDEDMKAFQWVADVLNSIAELKASTGRVTDAEYRERIEKLFKKARGGEGEEIKSRYVPKNILGEYKI